MCIIFTVIKTLLNELKLILVGEKFWKGLLSTQKYSLVISKLIVETSYFWRGRGSCQEVF